MMARGRFFFFFLNTSLNIFFRSSSVVDCGKLLKKHESSRRPLVKSFFGGCLRSNRERERKENYYPLSMAKYWFQASLLVGGINSELTKMDILRL